MENKPIPRCIYEPVAKLMQSSKWLHFIAHWTICIWLDFFKGKKWVYYTPRTWMIWFNKRARKRASQS